MYRLPSLPALRAFECVARHQSFAKAADELCVTAPSLSHHVKALEDELGYRLFRRSHRSIQLTDQGTKLYLSANSAFAELSKTWRELKDTPRVFKVTCGVHFMTNWLAPRSAQLQAAVPGYVLDHITTFEHLCFETGEVDLAIRNGDKDVPGYHCETIYREWWTPMVSPKVAKTLKSETDLLKIPVIEARHPREPVGHPSFAEWLSVAGVEDAHPDIRHVPHTETAMQMAAEGGGVKLCQSIMASELHRHGKLVAPFDFAVRREKLRFFLVSRAGEASAPPITSIKDFFRAEFDATDKALGLDQMTVETLPAKSS